MGEFKIFVFKISFDFFKLFFFIALGQTLV
jgi:hypothetical protein